MARRSVYLDHSATTPTDPRVVEAMLPYFTGVYGNASSAHHIGRRAEQAVEDARERIARVLHCKPHEIVFTSGGTESDNLAIRGAAYTMRHRGTHLITTPIEHPAILKTVDQLVQEMRFQQTLLPVESTGKVDPEDLAAAITPGTTVTSVMYVNNEVGTIEPIAQLAAMAHAQGSLFHTDAVQAAGQLPLDVTQLGIDMMSLSAHKFYGPKGVGALYVRDGIVLLPSQSGGSHENNRRGGTHNTPGIVGMAMALEIAYAEIDSRTAHLSVMRDRLIEGVLRQVPGAILTGHPTDRLPSHASFIFDGIDSNTLLMHLDLKGVCASSASACKTGNPEPSGVLLVLGYSRAQALGSLRLTVGKDTTEDDVEFAISVIADSVEKIHQMGRLA
ncbi:MAG: cysteine desulfurase family protein [Anaerolineae bacterium]